MTKPMWNGDSSADNIATMGIALVQQMSEVGIPSGIICMILHEGEEYLRLRITVETVRSMIEKENDLKNELL